MQRVAVIGLGRFGTALARQLARSGAEVIAADMDMELVNDLRDDVAVAVRIDSTDRLALEAQEIDTVDAAVVAIGENFEAALLTTVILKKLGVPRIVCRAQTEFHAEIFRQIGATEVIQPEVQAGERLGHSLANPQLEDLVPLGEGYTLIELRAPREFQGKSLKALALRQTYGVNLISIRRPTGIPTADKDSNDSKNGGYHVIGVPRSEELIEPGDVLIVVGSDEALARLPKE
jgi:trk system potassium uptake protein TrkA